MSGYETAAVGAKAAIPDIGCVRRASPLLGEAIFVRRRRPFQVAAFAAKKAQRMKLVGLNGLFCPVCIASNF
jgi:hypothetical protein